jgi:hypothetical protein
MFENLKKFWSGAEYVIYKILYFILPFLFFLGIFYAVETKLNNNTPETLKEFKDGVQNHLVWSIKGECFFVRPYSDVTVYLIRVTDCDKK